MSNTQTENEISVVAESRNYLAIAAESEQNINEYESSLYVTQQNEGIATLVRDILAADYDNRTKNLDACVSKLFAMGVIARARAIYSALETAETKAISARLILARTDDDRMKVAEAAIEMKRGYEVKKAALKRIGDSL